MKESEAPERPKMVDTRTELEKKVIRALAEHNILVGLDEDKVITPQQAMKHIRNRDFAYHHTEKGAQNGGSGGTFRITNLRWEGTNGGGIKLIFDVDSIEFCAFMPPAKVSGPWSARYRDSAKREEPKVRITPD
ncbi:MAG: hypothetical protein AAB582_03510 [Patescibacteria group bacterium]